MTVSVIQLPRGGTLIKTPDGLLQIGATPETIKDTLTMSGEVPDTFVLPNKLFSSERGVSLADIEFPAYYNFFIKNRPVKLIGQTHQIETIINVLQEAVLGPNDIDVTREFPLGVSRDTMPNLKSEMEFLRARDLSGRRKMEIADIAIGIPWGPNNRVPFGHLALERTPGGTIKVVEGAEVLTEVPLDVSFGDSRFPNERTKPFEPPLFGITVIGSGHGFDPKEMTSGFIVWVNRRGILVDPPVDSTLWLKAMDINPRLIEDCVLTHCHADHDAGTLQKLLEEKKINLYTTETIMGSFIRKYRSLTGLQLKTFMGLFNFQPVTLTVPVRINGAEFRFFYTLHSIPTIGFEVYYGGKSFAYSSDSLNDPPTIKKIYETGVINRYRMIELINFPWHHTVVFHEAGIPPIHTPLKNLGELPESVKEHLYLIHVSQRSIPPESRLKKAMAGPDETIVLPVTPPPTNEALEYLNVLNNIDLFCELPIEKAREFLTLVKVETYQKGDLVIKRGSVGDRFYMIVNGRASILRDGKALKTYTNNDYIGETSMILNVPRTADVFAESDLKMLVMEKYDFLYFIRGTEIARQMKIIAENREHNTWELFDESPVFRVLTPTQRTQLQGIMNRIEYDAGVLIHEEGNECTHFYLQESGRIGVTRRQRAIVNTLRGAWLGRVHSTPMRTRNWFSLQTLEPSIVYAVDIMEFYRFLRRNPGVFLILRQMRIRQQLVTERVQENKE